MATEILALEHHRQAMLALARRRVDVLWALVSDNKTFTLPAMAVRAVA